MGNRLTFWSKGPAIGLGNGADAMSKQTKIERLRGYWMKAQTEVNALRADNERLRDRLISAEAAMEGVRGRDPVIKTLQEAAMEHAAGKISAAALVTMLLDAGEIMGSLPTAK